MQLITIQNKDGNMEFWDLKTTLSHHMLKFQERETPTDFEYTATNDVKKIFSTTQEF